MKRMGGRNVGYQEIWYKKGDRISQFLNTVTDTKIWKQTIQSLVSFKIAPSILFDDSIINSLKKNKEVLPQQTTLSSAWLRIILYTGTIIEYKIMNKPFYND